jgi:hypothetical protein
MQIENILIFYAFQFKSTTASKVSSFHMQCINAKIHEIHKLNMFYNWRYSSCSVFDRTHSLFSAIVYNEVQVFAPNSIDGYE